MTDKPKTFEEWRKGKMVDAIGEAYDAWHARDDEIGEKDRRIAEWKERAERAETQLAGCGVAALGWNKEPAKPGDWGWSASYQGTLDLRRRYDALEARIAAGMDEIHDLRARGANSDASIEALYRGWAQRMETALKGES